jgi:hypothetical protein
MNVIPSTLSLTGDFPVSYFYTNVLTVIKDFPFLQGRGFVFASQYAKLLPLQLAGSYIDAAVQVMEAADANIPVKVSALRAVHK